ncbi:hypothetical protein Mgra_00004349 [Meloidogyne graminicola]|uniref:Uncharacterized protein n=1 Tax=Meloidogyne graminicola TaxID=189291 RepID=A0A8S9ZSU4_9BILA|nr:hypothetical protein Mgra_00004349 [Meloidogyne graminicola]
MIEILKKKNYVYLTNVKIHKLTKFQYPNYFKIFFFQEFLIKMNLKIFFQTIVKSVKKRKKKDLKYCRGRWGGDSPQALPTAGVNHQIPASLDIDYLKINI